VEGFARILPRLTLFVAAGDLCLFAQRAACELFVVAALHKVFREEQHGTSPDGFGWEREPALVELDAVFW